MIKAETKLNDVVAIVEGDDENEQSSHNSARSPMISDMKPSKRHTENNSRRVSKDQSEL